MLWLDMIYVLAPDLYDFRWVSEWMCVQKLRRSGGEFWRLDDEDNLLVQEVISRQDMWEMCIASRGFCV